MKKTFLVSIDGTVVKAKAKSFDDMLDQLFKYFDGKDNVISVKESSGHDVSDSVCFKNFSL